MRKVGSTCSARVEQRRTFERGLAPADGLDGALTHCNVVLSGFPGLGRSEHLAGTRSGGDASGLVHGLASRSNNNQQHIVGVSKHYHVGLTISPF